MIHAIINITCSVQSSGLGGMTHNTVMLAWPERWKTDSTWSQFIGNATPTNTCFVCPLHILHRNGSRCKSKGTSCSSAQGYQLVSQQEGQNEWIH